MNNPMLDRMVKLESLVDGMPRRCDAMRRELGTLTNDLSELHSAVRQSERELWDAEFAALKQTTSDEVPNGR